MDPWGGHHSLSDSKVGQAGQAPRSMLCRHGCLSPCQIARNCGRCSRTPHEDDGGGRIPSPPHRVTDAFEGRQRRAPLARVAHFGVSVRNRASTTAPTVGGRLEHLVHGDAIVLMTKLLRQRLQLAHVKVVDPRVRRHVLVPLQKDREHTGPQLLHRVFGRILGAEAAMSQQPFAPARQSFRDGQQGRGARL